LERCLPGKRSKSMLDACFGLVTLINFLSVWKTCAGIYPVNRLEFQDG
jgi:hypothetical protein